MYVNVDDIPLASMILSLINASVTYCKVNIF